VPRFNASAGENCGQFGGWNGMNRFGGTRYALQVIGGQGSNGPTNGRHFRTWFQFGCGFSAGPSSHHKTAPVNLMRRRSAEDAKNPDSCPRVQSLFDHIPFAHHFPRAKTHRHFRIRVRSRGTPIPSRTGPPAFLRFRPPAMFMSEGDMVEMPRDGHHPGDRPNGLS